MIVFIINLVNITLQKLSASLHNIPAATMASLKATVIWNHRIWKLKENWKFLSTISLTCQVRKLILRCWVMSPRAKPPSEALDWPNLHLGQKTNSTPVSKISLSSLRKQQFQNFLVLGSLYGLKLLRTPKRFCSDEFYLSIFTAIEIKTDI